eukprot:jgi/Astpho2/1588/e_gw1.00028.81.1_t
MSHPTPMSLRKILGGQGQLSSLPTPLKLFRSPLTPAPWTAFTGCLPSSWLCWR